MEFMALILFFLALILILIGIPIAFVLGGLSVIIGYCTFGLDFFNFLPSRIMGTISNPILMAVPLFIFMGLMLEKSKLAEAMLNTMSSFFGKKSGGLAIAVIIVGGMLAASTGVVGATVVSMGLISLPAMLTQKYSPKLATGIIVSAGSLGQIIPPSIVLILLGSVLNISVGKLFSAALIPSFILILSYILYIFLIARIKPKHIGIDETNLDNIKSDAPHQKELLKVFVLPFLLILVVLGSIFLGIATPTESAAVGAIGASVLASYNKYFSMTVLAHVVKETSHLTAMVFFILLGATTFSLVFRGLGGDEAFKSLILGFNINPNLFLIAIMLIIFFMGFFLDFIEIIFIVVPIVAPLLKSLGFDMTWIGILIAMNVQTSFLTPPFGFSLFYLKGVAPPSIKTKDIYLGVLPFIVIQLLVIAILLLFPKIIYLVEI